MKKGMWFVFCAVLVVACVSYNAQLFAQSSYLYGVQPGKPDVSIENNRIVLRNSMLTATWSSVGGKLRGVSFVDASTGAPITLPANVFALTLADGKTVDSNSMGIAEPPRIEDLEEAPKAASVEDHFAGKRVVVRLEDPASKLVAIWAAELREADNYVRQEISFSAASDAAIRQVRLFDFKLRAAKVVGTVNGSPVIAGNVFLGFEHPLSRCTVEKERVRCLIDRQLPLKAGESLRYSLVIGVSPAGQMRRGFLNYVERERAHPYRTFLHYNSWFDIGFGNRYDQAAAVDAINAFGEELYVKRGVVLDSFLFDDGWDDPKSLWSFDSGFPEGFTPVRAAAAKYGAAPGIWLSPWGGYDEAKEERMKYGAEEGFEMNKGGFALSGPKYFARFHDTTIQFILKYGINQFKIDGTGNVNSVFPGSQFDSDFHAAISLIEEWRTVKPDIFVNLTTGTYPSPFWLRYADSIWRGGDDDGFTGVGPWREKWITFRDAQTYAGVVKKGPLFPLNSLMPHGIIYARQAEHLSDDPEHVFAHEVHDYFGEGTQLQEMYITHALLSEADWDVLAETAKWSRWNAAILADTHWIGGDPQKLEVYGWAAWSPEKGIITLRNPSDRPQKFTLDVGRAFELPPGADQKYTARSPWKTDREAKSIELAAGQAHT
ncbi:MAG: hypothetical protein WBW49_09800, partial [Candidatus Acidiferrum sp.]